MRKMEISDFLTDTAKALHSGPGSGARGGIGGGGGRGRGGTVASPSPRGAAPPPARSAPASSGILSSLSSSFGTKSRKSSAMPQRDSSVSHSMEESAHLEKKKSREKSDKDMSPRASNSGPPAMAKLASPVLHSLAKEMDDSVDTLKNANTVKDIIKTQRANGSFSLDALKIFVASASMEDVKKQFPDTSVSLTDALIEIFITVIVCQYFKVKFADQQIYWNLVLKKALAWVKKEAEKNGIGAVDLDAGAVNYLKSKNVV